MAWLPLVLGVLAAVAFIAVERRSPHPMLPLDMFSSRLFTVVNVVTFLVYAALGGIFFMLVLTLQVAAGFTPLQAGTALLPITVVMLLLSERAGLLAQRIGPRIPMTVGPLLSAARDAAAPAHRHRHLVGPRRAARRDAVRSRAVRDRRAR